MVDPGPVWDIRDSPRGQRPQVVRPLPVRQLCDPTQIFSGDTSPYLVHVRVISEHQPILPSSLRRYIPPVSDPTDVGPLCKLRPTKRNARSAAAALEGLAVRRADVARRYPREVSDPTISRHLALEPAIFARNLQLPEVALGHVGEAREVTLEGDGDRVGRAVAVLGDDEVRLAGARRVLLVGGLAVQEHHHVGILLDRS